MDIIPRFRSEGREMTQDTDELVESVTANTAVGS
jgi:hypothetical protein